MVENLQQRAEVEWYRQHGRHPERIRKDRIGLPYVIGDADWNRNNPWKEEMVEHRMPDVSLRDAAGGQGDKP